jgi:hypothetical protein
MPTNSSIRCRASLTRSSSCLTLSPLSSIRLFGLDEGSAEFLFFGHKSSLGGRGIIWSNLQIRTFKIGESLTLRFHYPDGPVQETTATEISPTTTVASLTAFAFTGRGYRGPWDGLS